MQEATINYNIEYDDGFSQFTRCFVTKVVDSDGLKWTQLDSAGLGFGHNLDTIWTLFGHFLGKWVSVWFGWLSHVDSR